MEIRRHEYILAVSVVLVFLIIALIRLFPYINSLDQIANDTGNDWGSYAQFALDVKHNGILMPSVVGVYEKPASFLYIYFLAGCFALFGENNIPVYILQNLMLGLSVVFIWFTFQKKMSRVASLVFLIVLFLFGLTDVSIYYTFRFLGENLAIFSLSLFFLLFFKGIEQNSLPALLVSAFCLGISMLSRPNIFLFGGVIILFLACHLFKKDKTKTLHFALFATVLIVVSSFLAFRNYMVCSVIQFLPSQGFASNLMPIHMVPASVDLSKAYSSYTYSKLHLNIHYAIYIEYIVQQPLLFFGHYVKKLLFCFGFLKAMVPTYHWFPHWTLMWIGYFTYIFLFFRNMKSELLEKTVHIFILCYFCSLILVGQIDNYGFRMLIPGNFFVLPFSFLALDRIILLVKKKINMY